MRCCACDALLTDYDVTIKSEVTKEYIDMCGHCRASIADLVDFADDVVDDVVEIEEDLGEHDDY